MKQALIKEIMVAPVITVHPDERFSHVEEKLRTNRIRHLPVVNHENKVVGIITQRDLYHAASPRKNLEGDDVYDKDQLDMFVLSHFMTPDPVTLAPEDKVAQAVDLMAKYKYGAIPVVKADKTLVGIVTQVDVLKYLAKWLAQQS